MKKYLYIGFILPFCFSACNIINPKEQIPTYLHLEPFTFSNPDSVFTGSSSHSIPSANVFVNDVSVGIFDLPCTIPVMMTKTSSVLITPYVTNQGLKSYVFRYPFYQNDTTTLLYNPGKVQNYTPKTRYSIGIPSTAFKAKINFEEGLLFKNMSGDTTIVLEKDPLKVFEGKNCGAIYVNQAHKASENISTIYFERPASNEKCYMELDYKCSVPFTIGLQAEDAGGSLLPEYLAGFYPKESWSKLYIELSTFTNKALLYNKFYIILRANLNDPGTNYTEGYVLIDNIKVIAR